MAERKRIGVQISGIDTSTPDHSVTDGRCSELHNLRYTGGAWRNVHPFKESEELPDLEGHVIVYHHPADVDNAYITYYYDKEKNAYTFYRSEYKEFVGEWSWRHTEGGFLTIQADNSRSIEDIVQIGHFGKMLVIGDNISKTFHFFFLSTARSGNMFYSKTNFEDVDIDLSLNIPKSSDVRQTLASAMAAEPEGESSNIAYSMVSGADKSFIFETKPNPNDANGQFSELFRGEFVMVAALVSEEGEIIKLSPFRLFNSAMEVAKTYPNPNRFKAYKFMLDGRVNTAIGSEGRNISDNNERYNKWPGHLFFCEADATITISNVNVATRASYIDIYATRLYNLIEYKSYTEWGDNTTDLFQEPMYRAKRIYISEIEDGNKTFTITSSLFEALEHGVLLSPTQSAADLYGNISLEYNNRLHLTDVYTKFNYDTLYKYLGTDREGYYNITAKIEYDASIYWSQHQIESKNKYLSLANSDFFALNGHFTTIYFTKDVKGSDNLSHKKISLRYSDLYNISYALKYSSTAELRRVAESFTEAAYGDGYIMAPQKYVSISEYDDINELPKIDSLIVENIRTPNAVRVSAANIPYSFPYENSYRIGSNASKIISTNSAAIEMSDSKFGEFPLYVFTNEGIWAMQSGTETLYSAIIPINYNVIINPNTIAVNSAILYFTDKGINALSRDGSKQISSPIHAKDNRIPQWMHDAKLVYLPEWDEVMCVNDNSDKAYVLSLDNGVWSTRNVAEGYAINNSELIAADGKIYNLRDEKESYDSTASFALDLPAASTFSLMRSAEEIKYKWVSDWGVLKRSGDEDRGVRLYKYNPETESVTYPFIYVYRPTNPNFSLDRFNFQADVRQKLGITDPKELIFVVADEGFGYGKDETSAIFNKDGYPEEPKFREVNVFSPDGTNLIATLRNKDNPNGDSSIDMKYFYDKSSPNDYYGIIFEYEGKSRDPYTRPAKTGDRRKYVRIYPYGFFHPFYPDGDPDAYMEPEDYIWDQVRDWWTYYYEDGEAVYIMVTMYFDEDDSLLHYAYTEPLSLDSVEDPMVVCVYNNGNGDVAYSCIQPEDTADENLFEDRTSILVDDENEGGDVGGGEISHKIELSQTDINVPSDSKAYSVEVVSTCDWQASRNVNWITINTTNGNAGNTQFSFSVEANTSAITREGLIILTNSEYGITASLRVVQAASEQGGDNGGNEGGDNGGGTTPTPPTPTPTPTPVGAIRISTRPIKLGTMELKRAETIITRLECSTKQSLRVKVEGSIDTNTWHTLRDITTTTNKDIIIRRTPFSVKYLRFTVENATDSNGDIIPITDDISILAFELEYYDRMRHRMR